jgi:hypothetical protein
MEVVQGPNWGFRAKKKYSIEREDNYMLLIEKYVEEVVANYFSYYIEIFPKNVRNDE